MLSRRPNGAVRLNLRHAPPYAMVVPLNFGLEFQCLSSVCARFPTSALSR